MSTNNSKTFTRNLTVNNSDVIDKVFDKVDAQWPLLNSRVSYDDIFENWKRLTDTNYCKVPVVKKVIFNDPATIVFFEDGCKEVVKVKPGEEFDKWTGLAMCVMKRIYGPGFHGLFKKWCKNTYE